MTIQTLAKHAFVGAAFLTASYTTACAEEEGRVSTMTPFEPGDILVAATVMDNPDDDHAGTGRLIQYDVDLNEKGVLWIEGTTHKIGGMTFSPDKVLYGFAQLTPQMLEVDSATGKQLPLRNFDDHRSFSSITFGKDGSYYLGEHLMGTDTSNPMVTTKFNLLPGRDVIGDGHVFRYAADGTFMQEYNTKAGGGLGPMLAVTTTILTDDDTRMIYTSETGQKVMQYDLVNDQQLPDLANFEDHERVGMVLNVSPLSEGRMMFSTGASIVVLDDTTGEFIRDYAFETYGWAALAPSIDGEHIIVGNFMDGEFIKVRLSDGEIVKRNNIGQRESLSGVVQFPG